MIVGYFLSQETEEYKTFIEAAAEDEDIPYGYTTSKEAIEEAGVSAPAIVLYKEFDEGKNIFSGEFTKTAISNFVTEHKMPLVIPFTMDVAGELFQSKIGKIAFLFTDDEDADIRDIATEYSGRFLFSTCDSSQSRLTSFLGISKSEFPIFYILETGTQMRKFPLDDDDADHDSIKVNEPTWPLSALSNFFLY